MPSKGQKQSDEAKAKLSAALRGRTFSPETRAKLSEARRRRVTLPETRLKIKLANLGKVVSPDTREKMRLAFVGRKHSSETKERMRAAKVNYFMNNGREYHSGLPTVNRPKAEIAFEQALVQNGLSGWVTEHRIHPYRCDFALPELKIDVEVDGKSHLYNVEHDKKRDEYMSSMGWVVLRFTNHQVLYNSRSCIYTLMAIMFNAKKKKGE